MHGRPNDLEYYQGIYDAAKRVVEHHKKNGGYSGVFYMTTLDTLVKSLERALEGKGNA